MTQTFEQVDPAIVEVGPNVRLDPKMDKEFIASVRERGVLEPVLLYRAENGTMTVLAGQRRTLAARETGQPLPALISDEAPAEVDRLVDQYVENEHRAGLSNSERITAIEQMALAGLSDHQIAKRTATPKATVQAAKAAAQSPGLREFADQLTLDQAAVLAEFGDDHDAVQVLLTAAEQGRFDHTAQRLRNDRAEAAKRHEFAATLTAQGIIVVDRPTYGQAGPIGLSRLTDTDGQDLTVETHAACPGHAAYIGTEWRSVEDTDDAPVVAADDGDEDDEFEDEDEDEDGEPGHTWQPPVQVLVPVFVCTDPQGNGHGDRWADTGSGGYDTKKRAADMTDDERETARAERRHVIESNKAWKAATDVRRQWLATFASRKTAPTGAEAYLARVVTEGWGHESASSDALTLAGFPSTEDGPSWHAAYDQRRAVAAALEGATPKRALQIGLAVALATWETRTHPNTWRSQDDQTLLTLAALKGWGYGTAEIEDRMLTTNTSPE